MHAWDPQAARQVQLTIFRTASHLDRAHAVPDYARKIAYESGGPGTVEGEARSCLWKCTGEDVEEGRLGAKDGPSLWFL